MKNIIALATGMCDGVGYGDNARAALMTRGLAEMARLGVALGADALHLLGPGRYGRSGRHLHVRHSRNRRAGELIAQGHSPDRGGGGDGHGGRGADRRPGDPAAGVASCGVEMPITENVVAVVAEGRRTSQPACAISWAASRAPSATDAGLGPAAGRGLLYWHLRRDVAQPGSASGWGPEVAGSNPAVPTFLVPRSARFLRGYPTGRVRWCAVDGG